MIFFFLNRKFEDKHKNWKLSDKKSEELAAMQWRPETKFLVTTYYIEFPTKIN